MTDNRASIGHNSAALPDFVRRYHLNSDNVSIGQFSIIGELFVRLYGKLETMGYQVPDSADGVRIRPDVSVGQTFPRWLESHYPDLANRFSLYDHDTGDNVVVRARQYDLDVLGAYIRFIDTYWLPKHGLRYFRERDPAAVKYIEALLSRLQQVAE